MAVEWSPDYCLSCDRQCPSGAAYCCQSCRLADEISSSSSSPVSTASSAPPAPTAGFYLPPALNFSSINYSSSVSPSHRSPLVSTPPPTAPCYPSFSSRNRSSSQNQSGALHASPSGVSLSSLPSHYPMAQDPSHLSEKTMKELRDYENAFDQVRGWKRRMTIV